VNITLIPGFNPGPYTGTGNNTYLIFGRQPTLIDAATGKLPHLEALADALGTFPLARVLVTHAHSDHVAGCVSLAQRWPDLEFAKIPWTEQDKKYDVIWRQIEEGDVVVAGDVQLRVIHTPGHAPDHACFFEEIGRTLFCGDLIVQGSTVVIPGSRGGNLAAYLASLRLVLDLKPARVLPAHGPEIRDPVAQIQYYFDHRRRREDQIMSALQEGCTMRTEIVNRIYPLLLKNLRDAASESVLAHLIKLKDEGRVCENERQWTLV